MTNNHDWNKDKYGGKAHFFLGGAFENYSLCAMLSSEEWKHRMKGNADIECVFGNVSMIWNGGREVHDLYLNHKYLDVIHSYYASQGMTVRFICTNSLLNEYDLHDRYANLVLDIFGDVPFEIVVKDERLEDYLRNKYRNASFISSTTKYLNTAESIVEELKKDYKYVCLDYRVTKNWNILEQIPMELRHKVEILANEICPLSCKYREMHHLGVSENQLQFIGNVIDERIDCQVREHGFAECTKRGSYLWNSDLDRYIEAGFSHFKLQGRIYTSQDLGGIVMPYLIKPEYYTAFIANIPKGYRNFDVLEGN